MPLHIDCLTTDRLLPNNCDIRIKLTKAFDGVLYLAETNNYKVSLSDLKMSIRRIELHPQLLQNHSTHFRSGKRAIYPFSKTDLKIHQIPTGSSLQRVSNIYRSRIPESAVVVFIESAALAGKSDKNAQNFQHFNVNSIKAIVGGEVTPPSGYRMDYDRNDFYHVYRQLFDNTGVGLSNMSNGITPEMFASNYNMYAWDFTPDVCVGVHNHVENKGSVEFEVQFKQPTTEVIAMCIFTHHDSYFEIDGERRVSVLKYD